MEPSIPNAEVSVSMRRRALADFAFSNGVVVPKGFTVAIPSADMHVDPVSIRQHQLVSAGFSQLQFAGIL